MGAGDTPAEWATGHPGLSSIVVDGVPLVAVSPISVDIARTRSVETTDGEPLAQPPDAPAGYTLPVARILASLSVRAITEADGRLLAKLAASAVVRSVYLPRLVAEEIGAPGTDPTAWTLHRQLATALPGISISPAVEADGSELTVIGTGTPSAGEVLVPDAGGSVVTFGAAPTVATIWYPALMQAEIEATEDVSGLNEVVYSLSISERLVV